MINFGTGKLVAVPSTLADGSAIATPTPVILGSLQDITVDLSVDTKTLYGNKRYPLAAGAGKAKSEIKAKYAEIDGAVLGSLFLGKAATAGIKAAVFDFPGSIPAASPYTLTVAPPSGGTFVSDLGVVRTDTGAQLTRVASAPVAGQYSVSAGVYTFAAADTGKPVAISYEYSATSATAQTFALTNDLMGYLPSFSMLLQNSYEGKTLVLKFNKCISGKLSLPLKSDDFAIYDFEANALADAAGSLGYICTF